MTSANTDNSFASIDYEEMVRQRNEERQVWFSLTPSLKSVNMLTLESFSPFLKFSLKSLYKRVIILTRLCFYGCFDTKMTLIGHLINE